eukprot:TRINITY_DN36824_c0_g1_i1.p1 TRINITY_DN36824_c0_g1~~TRINITY_DN36824_c0_g1_i1.p1  ORF type:complete len:351 (+),score=72.60 TRINITY_DN36824_c0_g1_i1:55-1053(+)
MFSGHFRRSAGRFARWSSSAVAEPAAKAKTRGGGNSVMISVVGAVGTAAAAYTWMKLTSYGDEEWSIRAKAAERTAQVKRADPVGLGKEIADYLRFTEPEASPNLVELGTKLCVCGYSDELAKHEKFHIIAKFKEDNKVMSWADLGAFVAYHALLEMGAPLVSMTPFFGRSESQAKSVASHYKPIPDANATYDDLVQWGKQFDLGVPETIAVLGGQSSGSALFASGSDMELSHHYYTNILKADAEGDANRLMYGKALMGDEYGRKCCMVFAGDELYWNRYFVDGLNKILLHKWTNLRELPTRMLGTTTDAAWATRQKMVYGVQHDYTGSTTR